MGKFYIYAPPVGNTAQIDCLVTNYNLVQIGLFGELTPHLSQ